jgi:hypothetical protein
MRFLWNNLGKYKAICEMDLSRESGPYVRMID